MKRQQPTITLTRNGAVWGVFVKVADAQRQTDKFAGHYLCTDAAGTVLFNFER